MQRSVIYVTKIKNIVKVKIIVTILGNIEVLRIAFQNIVYLKKLL